jgi:hypothetical protein
LWWPSKQAWTAPILLVASGKIRFLPMGQLLL